MKQSAGQHKHSCFIVALLRCAFTGRRCVCVCVCVCVCDHIEQTVTPPPALMKSSGSVNRCTGHPSSPSVCVLFVVLEAEICDAFINLSAD